MFRNIKHITLFFVLLGGLFVTNVKSNDLFNVHYLGVPDTVKPCIEYTVGIWEQYLNSDVDINITISWLSLSENVLAHAKPNEFYFNFDKLFVPGIAYPKPLAKKIYGNEIGQKDIADIEIKINKDINWYIKTDENCPEFKQDLVTILFHEIAHGLGIIGNFEKNGDEDEIVLEEGFEAPSVFDHNIITSTGLYFDSLYTQISPDSLYTWVTSDSLFWGGAFAKMAYGDNPKLYAPSEFDYGSSMYHLDENTYPLGTEHALMTPSFSSTQKEIFREPGAILLGMLADIGWTDYFIQHTKPFNVEEIDTLIEIKTIFNEQFVANTQYLHYSFDGMKNEISINMQPSGVENEWVASIPAIPFERNISYYFSAESSFGDTLVSPYRAPIGYYSIFIGEDNVAPIIEHEEILFLYEDTDSLEITANVFDELGVDYVYLLYLINYGVIDTILLNAQDNYFSTMFHFDALDLQEGDYFHYQIEAVDKSKNANKSASAVYSILVSAIGTPIESYSTDFDGDITNDFDLNGFYIKNETGFSTMALHTDHPYGSPMIEPGFIEFTATLKYPIILRNSGAYMTFDEVVLVEPGEVNTTYGQHGFWDYVIVEGSMDKKIWYPFEKKGYDSSDDDDWLIRYYSNIVSENRSSSRALGDESLVRSKKINLLGNKYLKRGDKVFIRFRLYSDPYTNSWGWSIDNLKIQDPDWVLSDNSVIPESDVILYPNPCEDIIFINTIELPVSYIVYDIFGKDLIASQVIERELDLSDLVSGIYTIKLEYGESVIYKKIIKK